MDVRTIERWLAFWRRRFSLCRARLRADALLAKLISSRDSGGK
jgi:hypothetical protein